MKVINGKGHGLFMLINPTVDYSEIMAVVFSVEKIDLEHGD